LFLIGTSTLNLRSNTVRPPDENQHGSTRPNLLSGARRHGGGDDNILERLERDSARHASGNRSRAAWYAAAASLVLLMIVVLAWSAYDNASTVRVIPMTRIPADNGGGTQAPADRPETTPVPGPALVQVTTTPPAATAPIATVPPLVLLPSHDAASNKPPAPARPPELASTVPAPAKPAIRTAPTSPVAMVVARPPDRSVVAARTRKPGASPLQTEAAVDTDVALLSAIIIHDSAHAEEKAQLDAAAACARSGGKKCPGRATGGTGLVN
jgi:hypothetical protein